jgi:spectinomycin phosphotransferase
MQDRPDLSEQALAAALRRHYAIDAVSVGFVSGGQDASAWVYRVETGPPSARYLVKVREANGSRDVAAAVSRHLCEGGVGHVVAPVRSNTGSLTVQEGDFSFTVYPFIAGRTGVEAGLVERHWLALGKLVRGLHASVLPSDLSEGLATETYRPAALDVVRQIDRAVSARSVAGRTAREVATFWTAHSAEILELVERTEALGRLVERLSLPLVLCHADLHTWNVMIDGDGELWLIDWDEVMWAPKERDLMFVVGGIGPGLIDPHETVWFFEGYGDATIDPVALSYYRHAWAAQDIGGFGERVFLAPALGDESRSDAARILVGLFDPGEIVEMACASDEGRGQ